MRRAVVAPSVVVVGAAAAGCTDSTQHTGTNTAAVVAAVAAANTSGTQRSGRPAPLLELRPRLCGFRRRWKQRGRVRKREGSQRVPHLRNCRRRNCQNSRRKEIRPWALEQQC